ncbi:multimeric flavodoxin WrbA [Bernardetia litoralis DSM 6794]|uniref:Multimeric flavodoxin WrbA n=1 Tax=Bernardetia litoralis (strain ATCC 23117 / DSM 6794 / NBRC 15988 / NCIMB 1366 / Fx l1 / Sio-4) TaxID=880071 RepID=I4ALH0_BERLS|nr:NAD(P)H-dependent oxidoreductase [Bernardetia litoralis]AFM04805.1 multimeric flavodoxin WrbA [Bernardetia litoralis DSM 6794]
MEILILQGSARKNGNTNKIVNYIQEKIDCDFTDLKDYIISNYDYNSRNREDDFLPLIREVVEYDLIIFATPIYWYSMSGIMKTFFDRITDCLKIEKETGRKLRGKSMAMVSCGSDKDSVLAISAAFEMPFRESAFYLGMEYKGSAYTWLDTNDISEEVTQNLDTFIDKITK